MLRTTVFTNTLARATGLACLLFALSPTSRAATAPDPHAAALAILSGVHGAIDMVAAAENSYSTDPAYFHGAAARAAAALQDASTGVVARIEALVDDGGDQPWVDPLRGAQVNLMAAAARLQAAQKTRELGDFQLLASQALISMKAAQGRPTELGVLGGIEGALASTVLGVPAGGRQVDACAVPRTAPAWGVHKGYLAWISVPEADGTFRLEEDPGGTDLTVGNGVIVLHTPAADTVAKMCVPAAAPAKGAAAAPAAPVQPASAQAPAPPRPALFTLAQARLGHDLFTHDCVSCHGADLHGLAAPSVAGNDFLKTAQSNGWSLEVIRYLVFTQMPLNAAGSLTPAQYADVLAYLLASNCFPAGTTPFPEQDQASFANVQLAPQADRRQNALGVCPVT